jgi:hypothetical protein
MGDAADRARHLVKRRMKTLLDRVAALVAWGCAVMAFLVLCFDHDRDRGAIWATLFIALAIWLRGV